MNKKNIFFNVIKKEDHFSQLLVNLVNANEELRKTVQEFFFGNLNIEFKLFDTQLHFENGRPDIIFNLSVEGQAIIEVKTQDSNLTDNQPNGYVEILLKESSNNLYLFFLIPKFYKHEKEIKERFNSHSQKDKIRFKIFYWNDLVEKLKETIKSHDKNNGLLLNELINHLDDKFGFKNIKFTNDQIELMQETLIPSTILKLNDVINSLETSFGNKEIKWDNTLKHGGYGGGYGFWYKNKIWIGYWFELWFKKNAPLILFVDNNEAVRKDLYDYFETFFAENGVQYYNSTVKFIDLSKILPDPKNAEIIHCLIVDFEDKATSFKVENKII